MDLWTFGSEARGQSADLSSAPSPAVAPPRRRRRVHMRILIALAAVLALEACGESTSVLPAPDRPSGRPASVIVTPGALVLSPGGSARLSARVRDSAENTLSAVVTWGSSNTAVARVDSSGYVTSVAVGTATITATSGGISGTATVTVYVSSPTTVILNQVADTLLTGHHVQLIASAYDQMGYRLNETIDWTT